MWAAADGHAEVVELLLKADADFRTPLAGPDSLPCSLPRAKAGLKSCALVESGGGRERSHAAAKTSPQRSAQRNERAALAVESGHFELAVELLKAGATRTISVPDSTPLHAMTWVGNRNVARTKAIRAAGFRKSEHSPFIRELVKRGADVNRRLTTGKGAAMANSIRKARRRF
jgi:ankyrin repeat protein